MQIFILFDFQYLVIHCYFNFEIFIANDDGSEDMKANSLRSMPRNHNSQADSLINVLTGVAMLELALNILISN